MHFFFLSILDNTCFSFWPFSTFHVTKFVENLGKKCKKNIENKKTLGCYFPCQFEIFSIGKMQKKLFGKDYRTTHFFLVGPSNFFNSRSLSKYDKKSVKTLNKGNLWGFCHFRCQFGTLSLIILQETLQKSLLDNTFFPLWPFSMFQSTKSVEKRKKCI